MKPRSVSRGNRGRPSSGDMGPAQRRQDDGSSPTRGAEEERDDGLTVEEDALLQLLMKKNRMKTNAGGGRSVASLGGERRSKGGRSRSSASVISNPATRFELQASGSRKQSKVNKTKKNEMPMNGAEMEYLVALMKQEEERKEEAELLRSIERARELERRRAATFMPKDDLSTVESEASESKSKSKTTIDDTLYDAMESALSCVGEWTEGSYTSGEESEMSSESEDDDEDEVSYKLSKTEPVILNMSSATKMPKPTQAQNRGRSSASMTLDLPSRSRSRSSPNNSKIEVQPNRSRSRSRGRARGWGSSSQSVTSRRSTLSRKSMRSTATRNKASMSLPSVSKERARSPVERHDLTSFNSPVTCRVAESSKSRTSRSRSRWPKSASRPKRSKSWSRRISRSRSATRTKIMSIQQNMLEKAEQFAAETKRSSSLSSHLSPENPCSKSPTQKKQDADKSGKTFKKDEKKPEENAEEEKSATRTKFTSVQQKLLEKSEQFAAETKRSSSLSSSLLENVFFKVSDEFCDGGFEITAHSSMLETSRELPVE